MVKRQRCPLSTPEWKTIPFTHTPKTYKDALLDIFADVPGLLGNLDTLRALRRAQDASSPSSSQQHHQLITATLQECWRLDTELLPWFQTYAPPMTQIEALIDRRSRNESPLLSDVVTAHIMWIYWAVCILVYSTRFAPS